MRMSYPLPWRCTRAASVPAVQPAAPLSALLPPFPSSLGPAAAMVKRRRVASTSAAAGTSNMNNPQSAVGAPQEGPSAEKNKGTFRFWHDERRFKGPGSACVVQEALYAAGGVRTGGYPKAAPIPGPLGYQRPGDWDLLWSPARLALRAVPYLKPGQLICSSPGMFSLTRKRKLPMTLKTALGAAAWSVTPHSFVLPDELPALRAHMASRVAAGAGDELWILKTAQHLGKGLKLVAAKDVCAHASNKHVTIENGSRTISKPYVMAQRYVERPLLVDGRKFGIRVWVLVLGPTPLRAYLHTNGLILFATHGYDGEEWRSQAGGMALGHVTNYAQNVDGTVWDLEQFKQHIGAESFSLLWQRISASAALMCSAALAPMRTEHQELGIPPEATFELLGLDYLVDASLHPWLLEVNGTPSLAVDHTQGDIEQLIYKQKGGMARDMFNLLGVSTRFQARYEAMRLAAKQAAARKKAATAAHRPASQAQAPPARAARYPDTSDEDADHDHDTENDNDECEGDDSTDTSAMDQQPTTAANGHTNGTHAHTNGHTKGVHTVSNGVVVGATGVNGLDTSGIGGTGTASHTAIPSVHRNSGRPVGIPVQRGSAVMAAAAGANGSGAAARQAAAAAAAGPVVLPRRLRDQLCPRSDAAMRARIAQELRDRGAFEPLMSLFPMSESLIVPGPVVPRAASVSSVSDMDTECDAVGVSVHVQGRNTKTGHTEGEKGKGVAAGLVPTANGGGAVVANGTSGSGHGTNMETAPSAHASHTHEAARTSGLGSATAGVNDTQPSPAAMSLETALHVATTAGLIPWSQADIALRRALAAEKQQATGQAAQPSAQTA